MSVIRAFIAIDLTPEIIQRLEQVSAQLRKRLEGVPVRWVPVDNIHLTLKFLGDVSPGECGYVKEKCSKRRWMGTMLLRSAWRLGCISHNPSPACRMGRCGCSG